jgi:amino acid adenylation domain-containing protein
MSTGKGNPLPANQVPATPAQRRMWFIDQMMPGLSAYNVPWVIRVSGPLDAAALRRALNETVARHEAWRTVFTESGGQPVQRVRPVAEVPCELTELPEITAREHIHRLTREPFDLASGPLIRAALFQTRPDEHLLALVFHHIVVDGWSFQLFFQQLLAGYQNQPVPSPPLQYTDYAEWEATRPAAVAAEHYWAHALDGAQSIVELPADRPRPAEPSFAGGQYDFTIPGAGRVKEFARARGLTPFAVLLAAFGATVARFTGRDDLLIGVPVSGRTQPGTDQVAGLFTNTLPVRLKAGAQTTFDELLTATRRTLVEGMEHQDLPFERIADLVKAERGLSFSPLVQLLFQWEELPGAVRTGDLTWHPELQDNGGSKLDLTLSVLEHDNVLSGRITYAADLYDEASAARFAECWLALTDAALAHPSARLVTLPLTPPGQLALVTQAWAAGSPLPAGPDTAIALLTRSPGSGLTSRTEAHADEAAAHGADAGQLPQGVAGADGSGEGQAEVSARWERVARIAGALTAAGVGPESKVGLCLPRDGQLIDALLGIWWAGGAYVPLDPAYPSARLEAMVADAGVQLVLGDFPGVKSLSLDDALAAEPIARQEIHPHSAAYTIFTSGSTGRPKGVTVTQANVASMLRAFQSLLGLGSEDHLVAVTTLAFDISVLELLLPLACGAQVTVAGAETAADPVALRALLESAGATALQATPATWRALTLTGGVPKNVRVRLCGGEALPADLAESLTGPGIELWNVYGPTETTVWSAASVVEPGAPIVLGPPIPGTQLYVLDDALNPVPPGVTGQLFIGGPGVTRGYHGRASLTAQQFLPDPFTSGGRLYATGDLARWRGDGRLDFLGRQDQQIKLRGYRIELGEIEAVLRECPGVTDAVVTVSTPGGDPRLAAYVVGETEGLRELLAVRLPDYMLPSVFMSLAELPRTLNGKADRKALPEPVWMAGSKSRAPSSEVELQLARLWQELLSMPELPGAEDNFFALGGHSLTATSLLARVRSELGPAVPLIAFFRMPTVAALAVEVEAGQAGGRVLAPLLPHQRAHELDDDSLDALFEELMR